MQHNLDTRRWLCGCCQRTFDDAFFAGLAEPVAIKTGNLVPTNCPKCGARHEGRAVVGFQTTRWYCLSCQHQWNPQQQPADESTVISGTNRAAAAGMLLLTEEGTETGSVIGTAVHEVKAGEVGTFMLWPGGMPCCTPVADRAIDPAPASPKMMAAVKAAQVRLLDHLRKKCPDCCMGLTGWLPCEKHLDPAPVNPG